MLLSFTSLATLALAASVGSGSSATPPSVVANMVPRVTVDSTYALTEDQLKSYIAVKKALAAYWLSHKEAYAAAKITSHEPTVMIGTQELPVAVFNYPEVVKKDTTVALIFTANKFSPDKFEPTQLAAFQAIGTLVIAEANKSALPANTTTLGKNVALVKAHQDELKAAGVALQIAGGMDDEMGGNGDLNP